MSLFQYRALNAQGHESAGTLEADSARQARRQLREQGMFPITLDSLGQQSRPPRVRIRKGDLCLITRQFSALITSGLTIERALSVLAEQSDSAQIHLLMTAIRAEIVGGHSLHTALERFGHTFPPIYLASVAAGEKSGQLARVMAELADYLERQDSLHRKTLQAFIYPAIVAIVALLVVVGLMTYVVPQVIEVFQQGKQTLPLLTRSMVMLSDLLRQWGLLILALLFGASLCFTRALRHEHLRYRWDAYLLRLPLLGKHLRTLDTLRFASTLSILVQSGVPILAALDAAQKIIGRIPLRRAVSLTAEKVREGVSLSNALRQTRAFPPLLVHMIHSGEATGQLSLMLERAAQLQHTELENRTFLLTTLLEPLLLLLMGGTVLLIVLAVMQPIIEINTLMH